MEVYSFSGPSGTGKSTYALKFAYEHKIPAIIDDGLLIMNGKVKAGVSAKFEKSSFKAVKRAIFSEDEHVEAVQQKLLELEPEKLLIIGTSDKMTKLIAKRLQVGEIQKFYYIEQYRSSKEMKMAQFIRRTEGKHIMPISHNQVQQSFFKTLILKGYEIFSPKREKIGETTIVQPDFHHEMQPFDKKQVLQAIYALCEEQPFIESVHKINFTLNPLPKLNFTINYYSDEIDQMYDKLEQLQQQLNIALNDKWLIEYSEIIIYVQNIVERK